MSEQIPIRCALYYPAVCIEDVNWLKGTLLCFPGVYRMRPRYFPMSESEEVTAFEKVKGPNGYPLLMQMDVHSKDVLDALERLRLRVKNNPAAFRKYSRSRTIAKFGPDAYRLKFFRITQGKLPDPLIQELTGRLFHPDPLIWSSPESKGERKGPPWLYMHPEFGGAVLSIIAITLARAHGLALVTDETGLHQKLISQNETTVFATLLGENPPTEAPGLADTADELTEIVMTTGFDVSRLTAEQIAELHKEGKSLERFKDALIPIVKHLPAMTDPVTREKRLQEAAQEVFNQWEKYKRSLPKFAADALFDVTSIKLPEVLASQLSSAVTFLAFGTWGSLSLGLLIYGGVRILRKYREHIQSPYQYLTRISKATQLSRPIF